MTTVRHLVEYPLIPPSIENEPPKIEDEVTVVDGISADDIIDMYIESVEKSLLASINPKIVNYLRCIGKNPHLRVLIIGQEPYNDSLLPGIASAFAYDVGSTPYLPPSVCVLSQIVAANSDYRYDDCLKLFANSYALLDVGIVCLNVFVSGNLSCTQQAVQESHFAELVRTLMLFNLASGMSDYFHAVCLGEVAYSVVRIIKASLSNELRTIMSVKTHRLMHPVFVARSFEGEPITISVDTYQSSLLYQSNIARSLNLKVQTIAFNEFYTRKFSKWELGKMGPIKPFIKLLIRLVGSDVNLVLSQFTLRYEKYVNQKFEDSISTSMSSNKFRQNLDPKQEMLANYTRTTIDVLQRMHKVSLELIKDTTEVRNILVKGVSEVNLPEDTPGLSVLKMQLEMSDRLIVTLTKSVAFFYAIPALCVGNESAVVSTGSTVTPIIGTVEYNSIGDTGMKFELLVEEEGRPDEEEEDVESNVQEDKPFVKKRIAKPKLKNETVMQKEPSRPNFDFAFESASEYDSISNATSAEFKLIDEDSDSNLIDQAVLSMEDDGLILTGAATLSRIANSSSRRSPTPLSKRTSIADDTSSRSASIPRPVRRSESIASNMSSVSRGRKSIPKPRSTKSSK